MLKLFDSYTKKKRAFRPLRKGKVTFYGCGPTVYSSVHIGNLRTFLFYDLLRRLFEFSKLEVTQVMNITDVGHMMADADEGEDKMEVSAKESGQSPQEVAEFYARQFFRDIDRLNFRRADVYPKASEHVTEMIRLIGRLLDRGHAYKVRHGDGGTSVYFDVSTFPDYGKLSGNRLDDLNPGARIEVRDEKRHPADFSLWIHNPKHLMQWEAPWGSGYPGWHIECSAMAIKYLGETIDVHAGGEDNKFPHHECEIAQSECATGHEFSRYWLHVTHLLVDGEKMSKSKGKFFTLDDLLEKGFSARAVRYLLLSSHYRQTLNFTMHGLDSATATLDRLDSFADTLNRHSGNGKGVRVNPAVAARKGFVAALNDDLNVPNALAVLFDYVREANERMAKDELTVSERSDADRLMKTVGQLLGFTFGRTVGDDDVSSSVKALVEKREQARKEKAFSEADRIRLELLDRGYEIEDTSDGPVIKRK
ncbi:cysteine--tRNA ligase [Candidatus Uhrbacteria bacterium CG_4_10_14_0_8_um_filter_58_22]|uniref:Cysteine--tRNA ligase n=1 Tax=Candidatus Uhrbacteria bacterium CG_4_10_14_0_8_um_filter_58_22 TaxID=1975029 RepID=A0A2M7Q9X8_9BACT|nr:MAG: cysteine--tRNA ligase [Parcubacteria group bacterium CG1_02_58_44]PIY62093.1 MAG: cysteine--tRNA ligase [Candidatus Uhrbacteria bacterium CG_4_10_14_0_8_um_filter_58_22]